MRAVIIISNQSRGPVHLPSTWLHVSFFLPTATISVRPSLLHLFIQSFNPFIHSISIYGVSIACYWGCKGKTQTLPSGVSHLTKRYGCSQQNSQGQECFTESFQLAFSRGTGWEGIPGRGGHVQGTATSVCVLKHKSDQVMSWLKNHVIVEVKPSVWVSGFSPDLLHLASTMLSNFQNPPSPAGDCEITELSWNLNDYVCAAGAE